MKTLFTPSSAIDKSIILGTLISLMFWVYPEALVLAASEQSVGQNTALVFEINNSISTSINAITPTSPATVNEVVVAKEDPLVINLREYLKNLNSPLAEYAEEIVQQPQWQRALAISWVESNMGIHCADNNCSGIGVEPGHPAWRKYPTKLHWFKDMCQLLEKPLYKERLTTFKQMRGVYVKPGSASWVYGAQQKFDQLISLTEKSENESQLAIQEETQSVHSELALVTFPKSN